MTNKLIEVGIDWLTVTAPLGHPNQQHMDAVFYAVATEAHEAGHNMKNVHRLGYTGQQIAGMFVGSSKQGSMLQASSSYASKVLRGLKAVCTCIHVTRLDVQATIQMEHDYDVALSVFEATERQKANIPQARRWNACHYHTNDNGCTASIGSRSSEVFIRIYDKTREDKAGNYPDWSWRYEVELKGKLAQRVYDNWPSEEGTRDYCLSVVSTAMANRGVDAPWNASPLEIDLRTSKAMTDEERKLQWLKGYVSGTVQLLCFRGLREEVLDALGLGVV